MNKRKKIIHFNSKEGPVWRYETAKDKLLEELNKNYVQQRSSRRAKEKT